MIIRNDNIEKLTFTASGIFDLGVNPLEILVGESGNALNIKAVLVDYSGVTASYTYPGFIGPTDGVFLLSYTGATAINSDEELGNVGISTSSQFILSNNIKENTSVYLSTGGTQPTQMTAGSGTVSVYIKYDRIDF